NIGEANLTLLAHGTPTSLFYYPTSLPIPQAFLSSKSDNEITVSESEAMGKVAAISILAGASGKCELGLGLG
ncbi:MAG: hypothetical protein OXI08_08915, partial [Cyanobacteria bacterium MAG IRC4_bin_6]|nr:hypothetical protein [Cyanobacteria bacterium MAG IRC4_bin_6]